MGQAAQCTILVAGYAVNTGQEVAVATYTFTPPESPVEPVPMQHAELPNTFHQALGNVTVEVNSDAVALLVDNLIYVASS